mmetsp:Transcript_32556/g.82284  ORF Transcript_32556/g.82284 Transcript_32556/m.82284 type:complete len:291 (-) Transcript_32556:187-1059(-)
MPHFSALLLALVGVAGWSLGATAPACPAGATCDPADADIASLLQTAPCRESEDAMAPGEGEGPEGEGERKLPCPFVRRRRSGPACADAVPFGIQMNYSIGLLEERGWSVWYNASYADSTQGGNLTCDAGDYFVWGAVDPAQPGYLSLATFGDRSVLADLVDFPPPGTEGVTMNGAYFYRFKDEDASGGSAGFAPTDMVNLNTCDTVNTTGGDGVYRLCWHVDYESVGGWRSGTTVGLNNNMVWRKMVMCGSCAPPSVAEVPQAAGARDLEIKWAAPKVADVEGDAVKTYE